jgi:hypothetical protein
MTLNGGQAGKEGKKREKNEKGQESDPLKIPLTDNMCS